MKTIKEVYAEYMAWVKENNSQMSFEDYLWKICK